jgi:hypothetical protein
MTVVNYFVLTNSTETLSRRFMVVLTGYAPIKEKAGSVRKTLNSKYDISQGGIYERHEYVIRCKEADNEPWGTTHDLDTFFSYNNPNPPPGDPSNRLTMIDHYGNTRTVVMVGEQAPQPLSVMLEGPNSFFIIKAVFLLLPIVEGS